ncbi:MAG TPA: hypothetical protein VK277_02715 [Acidimicrobiales bacterium]|nr:hypothetical protein [Acidimicrobiales bacterium]
MKGRRHRARCEACGAVVESTHLFESTTCACGRLSLSGGPARPRLSWRASPGAAWTYLGDALDADGDTTPHPGDPGEASGPEAGVERRLGYHLH